MKALQLLFLLVPILHFSCKSQNQKINGISFVASKDSINKNHILPVLKLKSNFVALMPFGFVKDLNSPQITHNSSRQWFGETKNGLEQYAKSFQNKKIKIMVKPHIWVWQGEYTGFIEMDTEEKWKLLEASYVDFILTYAKTAQELQADILCIGTELEIFVLKRPVFWQELIMKVRKEFSGKLTYAANWDEFKRVPFWDKLDYIGIDAYFPLSTKKTPTIQDLENGWQTHKQEISHLQKKIKKPVLFTEFGYRSVDFNAKEPWGFKDNQGVVNLQAQVNALNAIHKQFWNEEWFAGGFLWKWFHNHKKVGGKNNTMFTPQNKPAEYTIRKLYQKK